MGTGNAVVDAILGVAPDQNVAAAMLLGSDLESSWNAAAVGDQGTSFGPFQIHLPAHPGVSAQEAENPTWAAQYMLGAYEQGVAEQPSGLWSSNPEQAAEQAAVAAERPAQTYYAGRGQGTVDSDWSNVLAALSGQQLPTTPTSTTNAQTVSNPITGAVGSAVKDAVKPLIKVLVYLAFIGIGGVMVVLGAARATGASKHLQQLAPLAALVE